MYDSRVGRWLRVDPAGEFLSPYVGMGNDPSNRTDPTGGSTSKPFDWVMRKDGSIYWDRKANSQSTTKMDETYLGKDLKITMDSFIDGKYWDGINPIDVTGSKMTTDIFIIGHENSKGELIGVSGGMYTDIKTNKAGFKGVKYEGFPETNKSISFYDANNNFIGFSRTLEAHSRVNNFEAFGLFVTGNQVVNVAQRVDILYVGKNLNITFKTDVFPSAKATLIGTNGKEYLLMYYKQPSYKNTHSIIQNSGVRGSGLFKR